MEHTMRIWKRPLERAGAALLAPSCRASHQHDTALQPHLLVCVTVEGRGVPEVEGLAAGRGDARAQLLDVPGLRMKVAD